MILVISGGGTRGFYAIGVLKGLEELGYYKKIKAVFGVSAGAIASSFWLNGYKADDIFDMFYNLKLWDLYSPSIPPTKSLLKNKFLKEFFSKNLKENFEGLEKKLYIGATDIKEGKFHLFDKGNMIEPLLGSMSIPGIFPHVNYKDYSLIDGGVLNNFPVELAKKYYKSNNIIGIALNKVGNSGEPNNIFETITRSWAMSIQSSTLANIEYVDYLFYPDLELKILDFRWSLMKKAFDKGCQDCLEKFNL